MERNVFFSCGCSAVVDPFFTVPVREVSLVCPVHVEREATDGRPETLAFFSDVEEVSSKFEFCPECGGLTAYAPTTELTREEYELLLSFRGCDCKIS